MWYVVERSIGVAPPRSTQRILKPAKVYYSDDKGIVAPPRSTQRILKQWLLEYAMTKAGSCTPTIHPEDTETFIVFHPAQWGVMLHPHDPPRGY